MKSNSNSGKLIFMLVHTRQSYPSNISCSIKRGMCSETRLSKKPISENWQEKKPISKPLSCWEHTDKQKWMENLEPGKGLLLSSSITIFQFIKHSISIQKLCGLTQKSEFFITFLTLNEVSSRQSFFHVSVKGCKATDTVRSVRSVYWMYWRQ